MRLAHVCCALAGLAMIQAGASAQVGNSGPADVVSAAAGVAGPRTPQTPQAPAPPAPAEQPPPIDPGALAQGPPAGTDAASTFAPQMIGDFVGVFGEYSVGGSQSSSSSSSSSQKIPVGSLGNFKVADDESPMPVDRVYFGYNYYSNATLGGPGTTGANVNRETFGFEKTFLDGNASFGIRAPITQIDVAGTPEQSNFGDLTLLTKYAFLNDRASGSCLSGGLALTVPTGQYVNLPADTAPFNPVILQPYAGGVLRNDRAYVQGFSSLAIGLDSRDPTIWFNDVGVGYYLYQSSGGRFLNSVIPTLEGHLTTPLSHTNNDSIVYVPDILTFTEGAHFALARRTLLTLGIAEAVTGPLPFRVEAIAQLNWRW